MEQNLALRLENVNFRYFEHGKRNILDHVSLDIKAGGITVLMGNSGCGKSTLAAVSAGLYPENGGYLECGTIELFGRPLSSMNTKERAGYLTEMFQNPDLQFCMDSLRKEMQFCLENICVPPDQMDERIFKAAKACKMESMLDRKFHTLSGGEKQRAALACLYVMDSQMILLDEAFANLDTDVIQEMIELLQQMKMEGKTIIAIDHQVSYWLCAADEIILLGDGGKIKMRGINRDNFGTEVVCNAFKEEGLFWTEGPEGDKEQHLLLKTNNAAILRLHNISIPQGIPKKHWLKKESWKLLLKEEDITIPKGSMTAILGSSGSGKTTTFLTILKQHPYKGRIEIMAEDLSSIKERELFSKIGIVFQNPANQFITQNVLEEVMSSLQLWNKNLEEDQCRERALDMLENYGLKNYQSYSPYMLSQGQQRRLAVLSVLAGGQKILLLDEPTYGQDLKSVAAIMKQLQKKVEKEGLTVIFITHDHFTASRFADQVYVLENQKLNLQYRRNNIRMSKGENHES